MEKKIDKNNIVKYVAVGLLGASLMGCVGVNIYDTKVDHTEEMCLICKFENGKASIDGQIGTVGLIHQMREMKKDYKKKDIDVKVEYTMNYKSDEQLVELQKITDSNKGVYYDSKIIELDGIYYSIPVGFVPQKIDGKWFGVSNNVVFDKDSDRQAIVAYEVNPETGTYDKEINVMKVGK